ncbi:unnamed protein product [marine sediment metagenome]|uniref:Uncharacterized protein n=1 Tax=marine sediment metagenome TaxID=412755 RepID=X0WXI9_9ZZZZ
MWSINMVTTTLTDSNFMLKAIKNELESRIEQEIEDSLADIQRRLREHLGVITLTLLKEFDVQYSDEFLTIRVRHEEVGKP